MAEDDEGLEEFPPDEYGGGTPVAVPVPKAVPIVPPAPAPPAPGPAIAPAALDITPLLNLLKSGIAVLIKAGTRVTIQQYTLSQAGFQQIATIPADALEWELFNATLTGVPTGFLDWAYVVNPGSIGTGQFNELASGQSVSRKIAGETIYVHPQNVGQVSNLEETRP